MERPEINGEEGILKTSLTPLEEKIRVEEYMLRELLTMFSRHEWSTDKNPNYSNLLVRLINNELKEPRL